jgi:hypothetical protein
MGTSTAMEMIHPKDQELMRELKESVLVKVEIDDAKTNNNGKT